MNPTTAKDLIQLGGDIAIAFIEGRVPTPQVIVARLLAIGLDLVPVDELRDHLDAAAAARIDREIDTAEAAKLTRGG